MPAATAEVSARVAVPFLLSVRVTPLGRVDPEARVMAGVGVPVVVTGKVKAVPDGTVSLFALVMVGALVTVRVKGWMALGVVPLAAWMLKV